MFASESLKQIKQSIATGTFPNIFPVNSVLFTYYLLSNINHYNLYIKPYHRKT